MSEQAPQRQDLSELVHQPNYRPEEYWNIVSRLAPELGELAVDGRRLLSSHTNDLNLASETALKRMTKPEAQSRARVAYMRLGALNSSPEIGLYVTRLIPSATGRAFESLSTEAVANMSERIARGFWQSHTDDERAKSYIFGRNRTSAMMLEAGISLNEQGSKAQVLGRRILNSAAVLTNRVGEKELDLNKSNATETLRRQYDISFADLFDKAKRVNQLPVLRNEFAKLQLQYIDTYRTWLESPAYEAGYGFEWLVVLAYRHYIYQHDLFDRVYARMAYPREDYPADGLAGDEMANRQAFDVFVQVNGKPHFLQCKVGATQGRYARPIKIVKVGEAFGRTDGKGAQRSHSLKERYDHHANQLKRYYAPHGKTIQSVDFEKEFEALLKKQDLVAA